MWRSTTGPMSPAQRPRSGTSTVRIASWYISRFMVLLRIHRNQPWIVGSSLDLPDAPKNDSATARCVQGCDNRIALAVSGVGLFHDVGNQVLGAKIGFQPIRVGGRIAKRNQKLGFRSTAFVRRVEQLVAQLVWRN